MSRRDLETSLTSSLDTTIDVLMAAMLLFLPMAFGTTEAWSQEVWMAVVAALGLCVLSKPFVDQEGALTWSWTYAPIVLFLLLTWGQLLPLPRGVLGAVSPGTLSLKDELLAGVGGAGERTTLSFYAWATLQQLRLVATAATVFVIVLHAYRTPDRVRRLLMIVTAAGVVVAVFTAYQDATRATMIYGLVPVGHPRAGPFQNYSHFSQFMNLSVGAAIGLLLMTLSDQASDNADARDVLDELRRPQNAFAWAAIALCLAGPVLVLLSMSRMGALSTIIAGGLTAGLVGWRTSRGSRGSGKPGQAFLLIGLGLVVFAVLLAVGYDAVYQRVASLADARQPADVRWQLLKDLTVVWKQFPLLGTGLGSHEFVFPMFNHLGLDKVATHAENDYAQLLEECGGIGLGLAVIFLAIVLAAFVRSIVSPRRPVQMAAFGLGFGLFAILIHSFTDFGQHVPANATLTAITAALLINIARRSRQGEPFVSVRPSRTRLIGQGAALAAFALSATVVLYGADGARRAEAAWGELQEATAAARGDALTDDDLRQMLTAAGRAATLQPGNAIYQYGLAAFRWQAIERDATDPQTRRQAFSTDAIGFARRVVDDMNAARPLCPTYGPPLCVAGQIRLLVLNEPAGEADIDLAYRLSPYDRTVCWMRGSLATRHHDWATAALALDRYLLLGGERWRVVDAYLLSNRPDLAYAAAAPDRANLRRLAAGLATWPDQQALAARCAADADQLLIAESARPDANVSLLVERAQYESSQGHKSAAVLWYQKAVDQDYGRADLHMQLAQAQAEIGQFGDAAQHLKVYLRLRPKSPEAERLLAQYAVSAGRAGTSTVTP